MARIHSAPALLIAKSDAIALANEPRSFALVPNVPESLFAAFLVVIDAPRHQSAHLLVRENDVVRPINADAKLLPRPLDQLNEVSVLEFHPIDSFRGSLHPFRLDDLHRRVEHLAF